MNKVLYPNISFDTLESLVEKKVSFLEVAAIDFVENRFLPAKVKELKMQRDALAQMGVDTDNEIQFMNFCRAYGYYYSGIMFVQENYLANIQNPHLKKSISMQEDDVDRFRNVNLDIRLVPTQASVGGFHPVEDYYLFNAGFGSLPELFRFRNFYEQKVRYPYDESVDIAISTPAYLAMLCLGMHEGIHRRDFYIEDSMEQIPFDLTEELGRFDRSTDHEIRAMEGVVNILLNNEIVLGEMLLKNLELYKNEGRERLELELNKRNRVLWIFRKRMSVSTDLPRWPLDKVASKYNT